MNPVTRTIILYLALVLAPTALLAAFALAFVESDRAAATREAEEAFARDVEAAHARLSASLRAAEARARRRLRGAAGADRGGTPDTETEPGTDATYPVLFARAGGAWTYESSAFELSILSATPDELRLFRLSRDGGESFEFAAGDPARAFDAYAFAAPRLASPALRSLLAHRAARAAANTGNAQLAEAILAELRENAPPTARIAGVPLAILAAARVVELERGIATPGEPGKTSSTKRLRELLLEHAARLSTAQLAELAERCGSSEDSGRPANLATLIAERERLEANLAATPELIRSRGAVFDGERLTLAEDVSAPDGAPLRAITQSSVAPDWREDPRIELRLLAPEEEPPPPGPGRRVVDVLLAGGGAVGKLFAEDPRLPAALARIDRRLFYQKALVALLAVVTLASGVGLVRLVTRERRLATLRARLLANVSHELKTPVTSIRLFAEMLAEDPLDESRTRRFGSLLRAESLRLSQLVENVLDFSRLDQDAKPLEREPVDVAAVLRRVGDAFAYRAREKGVEFALELEGAPAADRDSEEYALLSHAPSIERITLNLLDNALKYRRPAGARIRLHAQRREDAVTIAVTDNGPGVSRGERERIFEDFYRADFENYAVRGSGLGLAIARRLARGLGGDVRLESRRGTGSTFMLDLPIERSTQRASHEDRAGENGS